MSPRLATAAPAPLALAQDAMPHGDAMAPTSDAAPHG